MIVSSKNIKNRKKKAKQKKKQKKNKIKFRPQLKDNIGSGELTDYTKVNPSRNLNRIGSGSGSETSPLNMLVRKNKLKYDKIMSKESIFSSNISERLELNQDIEAIKSTQREFFQSNQVGRTSIFSEAKNLSSESISSNEKKQIRKRIKSKPYS